METIQLDRNGAGDSADQAHEIRRRNPIDEAAVLVAEGACEQLADAALHVPCPAITRESDLSLDLE